MTGPALTAFALVVAYFAFLIRESRWRHLMAGTVAFRFLYEWAFASFIFQPSLFRPSLLLVFVVPALVFFYKKAYPKAGLDRTGLFVAPTFIAIEFIEAYMAFGAAAVGGVVLFRFDEAAGLAERFGWWTPGILTAGIAMLIALFFVERKKKRRGHYVAWVAGTVLSSAILIGVSLYEPAADTHFVYEKPIEAKSLYSANAYSSILFSQ